MRSVDIKRLFEDFNITYLTEGKNCGPGWVVVQCPFCDDHSEHLGFNLKKSYFNCWRCGGHSNDDTIGRLLNVSIEVAKNTLRQYLQDASIFPISKSAEKKALPKGQAIELPTNIQPTLSNKHKRYLRSRGFNPKEIIKLWSPMSTGHISTLNGADYKWRIVIPIYWDNIMVSFQTRDITGRADLRYKTCPQEKEIIHHKDILYIHPIKQKQYNKMGILVEGVFDTWRMGIDAFATFGTSVTQAQINSIKNMYKKVFILFDEEQSAIEKANMIRWELTLAGLDCEVLSLPEGVKDPAMLSTKQQAMILKEIL